jgi:hypothetical protein
MRSKVFHGEQLLHAPPIKLGKKGYFDNWDREKKDSWFFFMIFVHLVNLAWSFSPERVCDQHMDKIFIFGNGYHNRKFP